MASVSIRVSAPTPNADAPPKPKPKKSVTVARLLKLAKPEASRIVLGTVFLALASAANLAFPQAIRFIVDEAQRGLSTARLDTAALIMGGIFAVQGIASALRYVLFSVAGERVVNRLRGDLFQSLVNQETAFFDAQRTGELTSRLSSDTTVLQQAVSANISMVLRNAVAVLGGLAFLFWTSPTLTALMLLVVPPVALSAVSYGRRVRKLSREVQDALAKSNEVAEESLSGLRTVRSFAAEAREVRRYRLAVSDALKLARKRAYVSAGFIGIASFAAYAAGAAVFWYGGRMVMAGSLSLGQLISFLVYTMLVAFSLGALSDLWADFQKAAGSAERVFELMERQPAIASGGGRELPGLQGNVAWEKVSFAYPTRSDVPVLKDFTLELKRGEVVALVGPSGAGKSTIASLLYRLYDPGSGRITLDGVPLTELDPIWLRRQIGVVQQEPLLFSTTVADNIRYGRPEATDEEVREAARLANALGFVEKFPEKFETLVGERGVQLSGGQKQRVAIARALLKNPRLLILDEATSALDAESEHLVREALERLMEGRTTLVIAHRLSTVKGADRVVVLDGGTVAQVGSHAELVAADGIYRRLVERQFAA
jgi:ABC transporter fused permease/ATP-binding protein